MEIYMTLSNYDFHFVAGKELCCGGGGWPNWHIASAHPPL